MNGIESGRHGVTLRGCLCAAVAAAGIALGGVSQASANTREGTTVCRFALRIPTKPAAHATYWVAYGPVAGRFSVKRMTAAGTRSFALNLRLPIGARSTFVYLKGNGVIHTRFGPAPGNPVRTLGQQGPTRVHGGMRASFRYHAPQG